MERKILVALDDSLYSRACLSYISTISQIVADLHLTLYHVQPGLSDYLLEASKNDRDARKQLEQIMVKNREKGVDLVNRCKEMILKMGIPEDRLTVVTAPRSLGLAK
ncbi:MAG: universal stress protein, partial [Thermodesulfobacteriota bacterium]